MGREPRGERARPVDAGGFGERGDLPGERIQLRARRTALRAGRALAEEGPAAERPRGVGDAAIVVPEERAAALLGEREAARSRRRARAQRLPEQRPLVRPELRLASGPAEVAAVGRALAAPAREQAIGLGVDLAERVHPLVSRTRRCGAP